MINIIYTFNYIFKWVACYGQLGLAFIFNDRENEYKASTVRQLRLVLTLGMIRQDFDSPP